LIFSCFITAVDGDVKKRRHCPTHWSRKQERAPLEAREEEAATACPLEPPKREIIEVTKAAIKEKANTFSSVGSSSLGKNECGESSGALSAVVFKGFNNFLGDTEMGSNHVPWNKRKSPIGRLARLAGEDNVLVWKYERGAGYQVCTLWYLIT
jgi:hypothetical protein